jgi:hypothetical protein
MDTATQSSTSSRANKRDRFPWRLFPITGRLPSATTATPGSSWTSRPPRCCSSRIALFNRPAEGEIELPDYDTQVKASKALAQIKPMRAAILKQLAELELLPQKLLAQVFES